MSNRTILRRLMTELDEFEQGRKNRDSFSKRFSDSIEALEGVPYSIITEMRDWQYEIETEGFYEDEDCESEIGNVIPKLRNWVCELQKNTVNQQLEGTSGTRRSPQLNVGYRNNEIRF